MPSRNRGSRAARAARAPKTVRLLIGLPFLEFGDPHVGPSGAPTPDGPLPSGLGPQVVLPGEGFDLFLDGERDGPDGDVMPHARTPIARAGSGRAASVRLLIDIATRAARG